MVAGPTELTTPELRRLAQDIRLSSLEMISRAGGAHIGSVFSSAEILAALYGTVLRVRPREPEWAQRDRFIMSKGHACAGLYAVLALRGFFPRERLSGYYVDGGTLAGHVVHRGVPGVEFSTGALGHGLAVSVGLATGAKRLDEPWRVFALLSDGECDEGSTWEAALLAPAWKLDNLTVIVDYNKIQSLGRVDEVLPLEPFAEKWRSFGWDTREVGGHDIEALRHALDLEAWPAQGRPRCLIAHTVKGKGVSFMEDSLLWHYRTPRGEELRQAMAELKATA
jgi:transketolase